MEPSQAIGKFELFRNMAAEDIAGIAALTYNRECNTGDFVVREGDAATEMYLIDRGAVEVLRDGRPIATVGPGEVLGEAPFFAPGPRGPCHPRAWRDPSDVSAVPCRSSTSSPRTPRGR